MVFIEHIVFQDIINFIDKLRFESNISIEAFCENIIDSTTYWRYLTGKRLPSIEKFLMMIEKLGIKYSAFFEALENHLKRKI
ncbi:helix-turn-helix domain-containing protein [Acholeplasma laidlawii]|uniref:helix-turn-helix domain-containing protein n=1 Tax=Acholeplasma laidlawii TaxID=2148 RepID=UPI002541201C|nr:helix-turn-helix transcriptional regulator [Acholeplasma laidlawii]